MNRRRAGRGFLLAATLLLALALPVTGWIGIGLSVLGTLCAAVALRLFMVGGVR